MTLAAFWDGDWQAVCTQHDVGSTDPAAWLRLAMAQRLLGRPDDTRAALRTATQLLLAQALLLSALDDAALVLIERVLPAWLEPCQRAPRARWLGHPVSP